MSHTRNNTMDENERVYKYSVVYYRLSIRNVMIFVLLTLIIYPNPLHYLGLVAAIMGVFRIKKLKTIPMITTSEKITLDFKLFQRPIEIEIRQIQRVERISPVKVLLIYSASMQTASMQAKSGMAELHRLKINISGIENTGKMEFNKFIEFIETGIPPVEYEQN